MKIDDEVIYTIAITGIKNLVKQKSISDDLSKHVGSTKMAITPAMNTATGTINISRLFTRWRGDEAEKAWQNGLMEMVKEQGASIAIDVHPWTPAPGYPQGDLTL